MTIRATLSYLTLKGVIAALTTVALTITTPASAQSSFFSDWYAIQNFSVEFTDNKLSIAANDVPVKTLLQEIQEQTGINIKFVADPGDRVTLNVDDQSIETVIAQISNNHMIVHANVEGTKIISELIILSNDARAVVADATSELSEFLPTGEPAPQVAAATAATPELTDQDTEQKL